jgi:hypothetical protein
MAKVTFETLNPDAPLFTELRLKKYNWWEKMKNHPDLYIEIRKDNNINVYYQGGSGDNVYYIKAAISADATVGKESWSITSLSKSGHTHSEYAKTTDVSSAINTVASGIINQISASLNNYVSKNASNTMAANSGLDFNTNSATLRIPVFGASDAVPASNGAIFIQKVD